MKNSFTLFEIILSIIISSLVIIYSLAYSKELLETNNLLLENIKDFNLNIVDNIIFIEINLDNTIKQKWSF
jgi:hypothetical protein